MSKNLSSWVIYTLTCPIVDLVRYVGFSTNVKNRYIKHTTTSEETHCNRWIRSIKKLGLKPILTIIEEGCDDSWEEREKYWIAYYRELAGDLLTNSTIGGEGAVGYTQTDETKERHSIASKRLWTQPEFREKMMAGLSSYERSDEWMEKKIAQGNKLWATPGMRERLSELAKNQLTPEERQVLIQKAVAANKEKRYKRLVAEGYTEEEIKFFDAKLLKKKLNSTRYKTKISKMAEALLSA